MIMFRKFFNRKDELARLEDEYGSNSFSFTVVYGRRRVGKTELISHFLEDRPHIYFLADRRGTEANLARFRKRAAEVFGDYEPKLETFDEVFGYVKAKWEQGSDWKIIRGKTGNSRKKQEYGKEEYGKEEYGKEEYGKEEYGKEGKGKRREKLVIAIDEFSYLAQEDESVPSVFQLIVDEVLKDGPFQLVLCGSSVSMMEKSVLAYSSPLYGRRTAQLKIEPIRFRHLPGFFPEMPLEELVKIYGAAGGIPFYFSFFDPALPFRENLEKAFFSKEAVLYAEGEFLLKEELRDPSTFMNILYAIAGGATRPGEIADRSFLEAKDLPYYLDVLMKLGFVRKEHPATEKPGTKKTIYRIDDPFLRFWFRFVLAHKDELEINDRVHVLEDLSGNYPGFLGETFEQISGEFLLALNAAGKLPFRFRKIGRQWGKIPKAPKGKNDYEIDLCALNPDTREILFCECKWQDRPVDADVYRALKEKAGHVKWLADRKDYFAIISKEGFTEELREVAEKEGALLLTLRDYFEML